MTTKLTLTIEKDIIIEAKKYAAENGRSVSDIVENYLKGLGKKERKNKEEYPSVIKELRGSLKVADNFDHKKVLTEELTKKYLSK